KTGPNPHAPYALYVYYDPSINNSGLHDSAWAEGAADDLAGAIVHGPQALFASDADKASALVYSSRPKELGFFGRATNGYLGTSDGLTELRSKRRLGNSYLRAADGNVVQVAEIAAPNSFTLALGFGQEPAEALKNARQSLFKG